VDAYHADSVPFHLMTVEFANKLQQYVNDDGLVGLNIIGNMEQRWFRSVYATWGESWPLLRVYPVSTKRNKSQNLILLATKVDWPAEKKLESAAQHMMNQKPTMYQNFNLLSALSLRDQGVISSRGALILTDDFAPTDSLLQLEGN
jgi:hypothetical protein